MSFKTLGTCGFLILFLAASGCGMPEGELAEETTFDELSQKIDTVPLPEAERHCISGALSEGEKPSAVAASEVECFSKFSDAIYAATEGAVSLPEAIKVSEVTEDMLMAPAATRTVISIEYQHSGYGGSSLTFYANNAVGCTTGLSYSKSSMPSGWNDVISSFRCYGGCNKVYHYEHSNYGGAALVGCRKSYIGKAMNDRTSSLKWFRDGYHY